MNNGTAQTGTTIPGYVAGTWAIDPVHSNVGFAVRHMMVSKVRGRFVRFTGQVVTASRLSDSSVFAEIDMASVDTGTEQRDNDLLSSNFFEVEKYPTMTYRSTGLRVDGEELILDGDLTLKGITRLVPLAVEINGVTNDPNVGTVAGFTATGSLNRRDFGVDFDAPLRGGGAVVADTINIELEIEAALQPDDDLSRP
ncbi:MAG: hypothetical protein GEU93_19055 [Propionibacteriales bacterium]|nr:hypothetical protein [Propionibacteriales bacterium]